MDTVQEDTIDPREFRNCMGRFATGVTVITTEVEGQVHGMTANGFMSISLEPPLVLVSVGNKARLNGLLPQSRSYGVSILSETHEHFSQHFAGRPVEGLAIPLVKKKGVPLLEGAAACLVAQVVDIHPAGDHTLYIGRVEYIELNDTRPLLFFAGKYRTLDPEPKHPLHAWLDEDVFFFDPHSKFAS